MPERGAARFRQYRPGDLAPVSGIYLVTHILHRPPHQVLVVRGEEFPPCRTCQAEVIFQVTHVVSHLTHDWDFAGLVLSALERKHQRKAAAGGQRRY